MKDLNNFIQEKLKLNKDINAGIINNIDVTKLKYFTQKDVDKIINWVNNDMSEDIRPVVATNIRDFEWADPSLEIFLYYTEDYKKSKGFDIPYITFFYGEDGLSVDIYDPKDTIYYRSNIFKDTKDLDKCFDFIESKYKIIKELIK